MKDRILWAKIGWSSTYQGDAVEGSYNHPPERRAEMFNFLPDQDGRYLGYAGQIHGSPPTSEEPNGWTVIFLSKKPGNPGVHIVGWYENATLLDEFMLRDDVRFPCFDGPFAADKKVDYSVVAKSGFLVPPMMRQKPIVHSSLKRNYSYLSGPNIEVNDTKRELRKIMKNRIKELRFFLGKPQITAPMKAADPLLDLGTAEHRRLVETKAVAAVTLHLEVEGYTVTSHESLNLGYDLHACKGDEVRLIEVKGTASKNKQFFITPNEFDKRNDPDWEFALVTDALGSPVFDIIDLTEFEARFHLTTRVWIGREKTEENL